MTARTTIRPGDCADALAELRDRSPLVQCLTNIVAAQWTANVLLAVGAAPAM
ncbi:MAG TPA: hydroxyethylthiazole kinase, partial [Nakamurella sp.]